MKLTVKEKDGCCELVHIEYTPAEALIINQAMRLYLENDYVTEENRDIMRKMLDMLSLCLLRQKGNTKHD